MEEWSLSADQTAALAREAVTYALTNGMVVVAAPAEGEDVDAPCPRVVHAPVTLVPSPFNQSLFRRGKDLALDYNLLTHRICLHESFLEEELASAAQTDDFVHRKLEILRAVRSEGAVQHAALGLFRSDYMLHQPEHARHAALKQIELNTISSSFGALNSVTSRMHRFLLTRHQVPARHATHVPLNGARDALVDALAEAWRLYGDESAVVLFIVQAGERNAFDQRWLDYGLHARHHIPVLRRTLAQVAAQGVLEGDARVLRLDGKHTVAVAYFRAGYTPDDYPSEAEWAARLLLERSRAIKSPSIAQHLAGTKKIQQVLAREGVVERFLVEEQRADRVRQSFAGLWALGDADHDSVVARALGEPDAYVLKPQREGGGNNLYGEELVAKLRTAGKDELAAYILMERIFPPAVRTVIVRGGETESCDAVSELGMFGILLSDGVDVRVNKWGGHLLRTKSIVHNDGGVAAGVAVLDSPHFASPADE